MSRPLLFTRRFAPLFCCQFFAAFNDNFLKTALVFVVLFHSDARNGEALITLASAVFIAPYFFLSALGGQLADRYDKARVAQRLKFTEIFVAALAAWAYVRGSLVLLYFALFGFGTLGALFGPIKYGILPDHLRREQLPSANALVEGATFVAILLGTIAGGLAARAEASHAHFVGLIVGFAITCWLSALLIPPTGEGAPGLQVTSNIVTATASMIHHLRADPRLWWGAMVTSWFWLTGIIVLSLLPPLIKTLVGGDENAVTAYLAIFTVAVGAGSGLAAAIARGRIVLKTTLVGAVLLGIFAIDLGAVTLGAAPATAMQAPHAVFSSAIGIRVAADLCGIAVAGGLFIVPAFAAVQAWSDPGHRARTIAAVNVLNAAFMTGATIVIAATQKLGATVPALFLLIGATTLVVALAIWKTMPKSE
jgi:acyl-[acyl-carrier-protein]-phospholipid O-acyltransferase/long-chain-fatty-acid--[acyl-carrier-protein] ligase